MSTEKTCWNGHDPIKWGVLCTEAGAVNRLLDKCPLCDALEKYSETRNGECEKCAEGYIFKGPKGSIKRFHECLRCGEEIDTDE